MPIRKPSHNRSRFTRDAVRTRTPQAAYERVADLDLDELFGIAGMDVQPAPPPRHTPQPWQQDDVSKLVAYNCNELDAWLDPKWWSPRDQDGGECRDWGELLIIVFRSGEHWVAMAKADEDGPVVYVVEELQSKQAAMFASLDVAYYADAIRSGNA